MFLNEYIQRAGGQWVSLNQGDGAGNRDPALVDKTSRSGYSCPVNLSWWREWHAYFPAVPMEPFGFSSVIVKWDGIR